jgi:hypothetical protein
VTAWPGRLARRAARAALPALLAVQLAGCPRAGGGKAVPAEVEIDWPDAAVLTPTRPSPEPDLPAAEAEPAEPAGD